MWLLDRDNPTAGAEGPQGRLRAGLQADKMTARLTVETDAAVHYPVWAKEQGVDDLTYSVMASSGGDPDEWWVVPRPVRRTDIVALDIYPGLGRDTELHIEGDELKRLFRSVGARRALDLPRIRKFQYRP